MVRVRIGVGVAFWTLLVASPAGAAELFVAPDGDDGAAGTLDAPFASVERAQQAASPGDTVYLRGGEYRFSGTTRTVGVSFTKSGRSGSPIRYFAYEGEVPIFDLFALEPQARVTGLDVQADWLHLRGIEVRGVQQRIVGDSWGVRIRGSHNVLEALNVHDCQAPGMFITSGGSNLLLNCDSHHNYDPLEGGENADGFGCHSTGADNVLRGCRGYENADDGFDFINSPGRCTVEHSWAFRNGFVPESDRAAGNGAGFKSGGFGSPPRIPSGGAPRHVVRFNVAFGNRAQGFYANHHPGGLDFFNNTAFGNGVNFDMLVEGGRSTHALHNNVAMAPGQALIRFSGGEDTHNSWNLPVTVSGDDFLGMDVAEARAPRQADGSLPRTALMRLAEGSDLIDQGRDVGLPFEGSAPDLGAFEWGAEPDDTGSADAGAPADAGVGDAGVMPSDAGSQDAGTGGGTTAGSTGASTTGLVGATSAGTTGAPTTGSGVTGGSGTANTGPVTSGASTAGVSTTGAVTSGSATGSSSGFSASSNGAVPTGTPFGATDDGSGCACRASGGSEAPPLALAFALLLWWRARPRCLNRGQGRGALVSRP